MSAIVLVAEASVGVAESVTFTVTVEVPAEVGVPVSTPAVDSDSPAGSEPLTLQWYGAVPPEAASVAEYALS